MKIKLFGLLLGLLLLGVLCSSTNAKPDKVILYFFWGDGCPHCAKEKPFLEKLEKKYPQLEVNHYEVWNHQENAKLFSQMTKVYGKEARGAPTTFLGDKVLIGWTDQIGKEMEEKVKYCIQQGCIDPIQKLEGTQKEEETTPGEELCIHVFLKDGCPQCDRVASYLDSLSKEFNLKLKMHDVSTPEEKEIYEKFKKSYGLYEAGFPIVFRVRR